ncbi:TRZ/ATZ family hydrolase [Gynuella sunshinyii]|uniref:5-methylthioadenosine/S-adenosylhomocysteine deaminase n=1 Tax=Gynuella sunshinyii YC6258 TaxID=1445510 RepID=A0A0C5VP68_9GAMM|nr:TRZ/ATZ family hydrolase [Gynuella sunshinyii]AJQ96452.1 cytosine deaminase and related metal-dependent hydrolase [Gynuella sunshinyii YC6258]
MQKADTILFSRWIVTVNAQREVLENHALVIDQQKIKAILPADEVRQQFEAGEEFNLGDSVLMPGLVNTHGHAAMTMFRGMADDLPLMTWLNDHMWPAEGKWVSEQFVADGTRIAIGEMIRCGTTTFSDNYFFPEQAALEAKKAGIRAQLNFPIMDFPTAWAQNPDEYIKKGLALREQFANDDQVHVVFGPHAPYTVSDEPLKKIAQLAKEHNILIQMHVHETQVEVDESIEKYGKRPIRRLYDLGLLGPHMQCVHMTALNDEDIQLIAETGSHVMHCPESNLKLASGFCPVHKLQEQGINVSLGTDGTASNNDLDMFGEMRTAAQLAKAVAMNAEALPAGEALAMATINGAKALGLDNQIGSLEVGKLADIIAVDLSDLESQPIFSPVSHLVYATTRNQVTDVWVGGKQLMTNRELTTLSKAELISTAQAWQSKIIAARS